MFWKSWAGRTGGSGCSGSLGQVELEYEVLVQQHHVQHLIFDNVHQALLNKNIMEYNINFANKQNAAAKETPKGPKINFTEKTFFKLSYLWLATY